MHRGTLTLLMFCFMALLIGCAPQAATTAPESGAGVLSAWIVDWDLEQGLEEWKAQRDVLRNVYAFGAYFDARGDVFLAAPWVRLLAGGASCWNGPPPQSWLTVVNDRVTAQGAVQKDPELVRALLSNPLFRRRYMQTFTTLVATYGFQGLELDFEKVYPADWPHYLRFCSQLAEILRHRNIAFRVVLQPQRAYISDVLPKDLDYCVMGYNLYGHHSGPGPKATPDFLRTVADMLRESGVLNKTGLALATGGFDWKAEKDARNVTEKEALSLAQRYGAAPVRDQASGYLVFRYRSENSEEHEVWYADAATLSKLWEAAYAAGFRDLTLWRLGGNASGFAKQWRAAP